MKEINAVSALKDIWRELTHPRVQEEKTARQEYMTRVIFALVTVALILMTLVVIVTNYWIGESEAETMIIMLSMDVIVFAGWFLISRRQWYVSSHLLPGLFLVYSVYMVFTRGMVTTAVLQMAIVVILVGMLSGNRARWISLLLCVALYLLAGWLYGERELEMFLVFGILISMSLSGIALLEQFFSNLLNRSLRIAYKREAELRSIFRAAPIGIGMVIDRVIQEANDTLCQMTGYSREELVGQSARILYPSDEEFEYVGMEKYRQIHEREIGTVETRWQRRDGELRDILLSSVPLDPGDLLRGVTFSALDITERKQAETEQKALLKEKEILLAEVHHRVKNNMQIITSLLSLQAEEVTDPPMLKLVEESRSRIHSMSLVHELLYRSGDYASIDFAGYVNQLASALFRLYQVDADEILFELESENVKLDLVRAIPCGLLLNEMITNSLKYAFPGGREGRIWVKVQKGNKKVTMDVGDVGAGLPPGVDFQTTKTLGLQLINLLVTHDLQGNISCESSHGTRFHVEFPAS